MRVLVVTAVPAESEAVTAGLRGAHPAPDVSGAPESVPLPGRTLLRVPCPAADGSAPGLVVDVLAGGVGPGASAAATAGAVMAGALHGRPYGLVVSAGIGGGFAGTAPVGSVVVADTIVAADLGAETPEGFLPVTELGFGTSAHRPPAALSRALAAAASAASGPVLTVSTVTGSAARAAELAARYPGAAAEAMEGFGVAEAAAAQGLPVLELRAVSNPVGPRDRAAWRIGPALTALSGACGALVSVLHTWEGPVS
ncbi:futalosine hydrolase [Streptomyces sp. NPDC002055]|uniref:futalosine hydrolase n=1 Tax=Streptomyces sp. NPDC002055 TaxID=3154534 RepID=UPI003320DC0A